MKTILKFLIFVQLILAVGCSREAFSYFGGNNCPVVTTGDAEAKGTSVTLYGEVSGLKLIWDDYYFDKNPINAYFLLSADNFFRDDVSRLGCSIGRNIYWEIEKEEGAYQWYRHKFSVSESSLLPNTTYYYKFCMEQGKHDDIVAEVHGEVKSFRINPDIRVSVQRDAEYIAEKEIIIFYGAIGGLGYVGERLNSVAFVISQSGDVNETGSIWFWESEYHGRFDISYTDGYYFVSFQSDTDKLRTQFPEQFCYNLVCRDEKTGETYMSSPWEFVWPESL